MRGADFVDSGARGALLALVGALYLRLKSETHALTQSFKLRLLTGQPQLRMLLLQTVKNLGKATMAVGKEVVHRHFKALLPGTGAGAAAPAGCG